MIGKSWRFITRSKVAVRHPKKFERDIGEVAVVTHGTSDIGSTCVENLLENGIKLLVFGGEDAKGEEYAEELRYKYKRSVSYVNFDVTKKRHVDHLFKQISTEYRPCDILINAPAVTDEKSPSRMIDVDIIGLCNCTEAALRHMSKANGGCGGTIVNVSSILAMETTAGAPFFTATKNFALGLARSYGRPYHFFATGVKFMAMCAGMTTERFDELATKEVAKFGRQELCYVGECLIHMLKSGMAGSVWCVENGKIYEIEIPDRKSLGRKVTYFAPGMREACECFGQINEPVKTK